MVRYIAVRRELLVIWGIFHIVEELTMMKRVLSVAVAISAVSRHMQVVGRFYALSASWGTRIFTLPPTWSVSFVPVSPMRFGWRGRPGACLDRQSRMP